MLVRGLAWSVVDDADVAELLRRQPDSRVVGVEGAGHSIQGDRPLELAAILSDFLFADTAPDHGGPPGLDVTSGARPCTSSIIVIVPTFIGLCFWQINRALGGNGLSWAYVFEWPFFAGYAVYMWWRFVHESPDGNTPSPAPSSADPVAAAAEAEELAAYNRYLADLDQYDRTKRGH